MSAIGIDLGTTNCCVGVIKHGKLQIVPNKLGQRITPSVIAFNGDDIIIGESAKKHLLKSPESTIYGMKYLIGRKFSEPQIRNYIKKFAYSVANKSNRLMISLKRQGDFELFAPEELCGYILSELRQCAGLFLDDDVRRAVITVPTYFNDAQRQATIDAGKIAGFTEVKLLNEATAAALAYGEENTRHTSKTILVYDFGGGTFDVSVIRCDRGQYEVLAIDGHLYLGGDDINDNLLRYFLMRLKKDYKFDATKHARKLNRIKAQCESVKKELVENYQVDVEFDSMVGTKEIEYHLNRCNFDDMNREILDKTMRIVERCLKKCGLSKEDIDEVVLVGGSTRIVRVESMLTEYFGKDVKRSINADEAVAAGAAIAAAEWEGFYPQELSFCNLTPYNLGVETSGGMMSVLIPKYSKLPIKRSGRFKTIKNNQESVNVKIYSGDSEYTKDNILLGSFTVSGISSGPKGKVLEETFDVDESGILTVTAVEPGGSSEQLVINVENGRLGKEEIQEMHLRVKDKLRNSMFSRNGLRASSTFFV